MAVGFTNLTLTGSARAWARIAFSAAFVMVQATLVITAGGRPEAAFGFRMFSESSTISYSLSREVRSGPGADDVVVVPVPDGEWSAKDSQGVLRHVSWRDRVKRPELGAFDATFHASYSARAQLSRLTAALDDVAAHTPDDRETVRLLLDVTIRHNGREPEVIHLQSARRL